MSNKAIVMALVAGLAFAAGCKSEIDDQPAAEVSKPSAEEGAEEANAEEAEEAADDEEAAESRVVDVSVEDSKLEWYGAKVTGDHTGGFENWRGTITESGGEVEELEFAVDTTSITSDTEKLTAHLKSDDFFHVEEYPEAEFSSKKIVEEESEGKEGKTFSHKVTGDFTIRGVTNEVTFPANIEVGDDKVVADTEFTINRFDFDIEYKGKPDDLIRKEVLLDIDLVAPLDQPKQAEAEVAK